MRIDPTCAVRCSSGIRGGRYHRDDNANRLATGWAAECLFDRCWIADAEHPRFLRGPAKCVRSSRRSTAPGAPATGGSMKKSGKKLQFTKEKVRELTQPQLDEVAGGRTTALSCGGSCESQCFSCGPAC